MTAQAISGIEAFIRLRSLRAEDPDAVGRIMATRRRRELLRGDKRLFIVAADHPARGALAVGTDAEAMSDRYALLERLSIALTRPGVDGVLGTPDIIEDLALLGLLDDKIVVGSMNRGGLRGSVFEMDDRFGGYTVPAMVKSGVDLAKVLLRVNLQDHATASTLEATAHAVTEAAEARMPIVLEPFMSRWQDGRVVNDLSTSATITLDRDRRGSRRE